MTDAISEHEGGDKMTDDTSAQAAPPGAGIESAEWLARAILGVKHPRTSNGRWRMQNAVREALNWEQKIRADERARVISELKKQMNAALQVSKPHLHRDYDRGLADGATALAQTIIDIWIPKHSALATATDGALKWEQSIRADERERVISVIERCLRDFDGDGESAILARSGVVHVLASISALATERGERSSGRE